MPKRKRETKGTISVPEGLGQESVEVGADHPGLGVKVGDYILYDVLAVPKFGDWYLGDSVTEDCLRIYRYGDDVPDEILDEEILTEGDSADYYPHTPGADFEVVGVITQIIKQVRRGKAAQ